MNKYLIHNISVSFYFLYLLISFVRFPLRFYGINKKLAITRSFFLSKTLYKNIDKGALIQHGVQIPYRLKLSIKKNVLIKSNVKFSGNGSININKNSTIQEGTYIDSKGNLYIGTNTVIGKNCEIHTHRHIHKIVNNQLVSDEEVNYKVVIDDNVFIYNNVIILAGVHINPFIVLGNSTIVTQNLIKPGFYAGTPAQFINYL